MILSKEEYARSQNRRRTGRPWFGPISTTIPVLFSTTRNDSNLHGLFSRPLWVLSTRRFRHRWLHRAPVPVRRLCYNIGVYSGCHWSGSFGFSPSSWAHHPRISEDVERSWWDLATANSPMKSYVRNVFFVWLETFHLWYICPRQPNGSRGAAFLPGLCGLASHPFCIPGKQQYSTLYTHTLSHGP